MLLRRSLRRETETKLERGDGGRLLRIGRTARDCAGTAFRKRRAWAWAWGRTSHVRIMHEDQRGGG